MRFIQSNGGLFNEGMRVDHLSAAEAIFGLGSFLIERLVASSFACPYYMVVDCLRLSSNAGHDRTIGSSRRGRGRGGSRSGVGARRAL